MCRLSQPNWVNFGSASLIFGLCFIVLERIIRHIRKNGFVLTALNIFFYRPSFGLCWTYILNLPVSIGHFLTVIDLSVDQDQTMYQLSMSK